MVIGDVLSDQLLGGQPRVFKGGLEEADGLLDRLCAALQLPHRRGEKQGPDRQPEDQRYPLACMARFE